MNTVLGRRFGVVLACALLVLGCNQSKPKENLNRYIQNDELLVSKLLTNVSSEADRFLIFSKDLCRKCFRLIVEHFENQKERGNVILLGGNEYAVKRLNTVYNNSLKVYAGKFVHYDELKAQFPSEIRGYVRYVEIGSDTLIYEGSGENRTEKTLNVLKFFIERDKKYE